MSITYQGQEMEIEEFILKMRENDLKEVNSFEKDYEIQFEKLELIQCCGSPVFSNSYHGTLKSKITNHVWKFRTLKGFKAALNRAYSESVREGHNRFSQGTYWGSFSVQEEYTKIRNEEKKEFLQVNRV